VQFEHDLGLRQFFVYLDIPEVGEAEFGDLEVVHVHEFVDDLQIFGDVEENSVLGVHHHVLTRVDNGLDPEVSLVLLAAQLVVVACGFESVVPV
jgi:hypothetical protein